jgi:hypothetical protein
MKQVSIFKNFNEVLEDKPIPLILEDIRTGKYKNAIIYLRKSLAENKQEAYEKAKKSLIAAKGFIDLAAENAETKDSPKTLWLKGEIYSNFLVLGMQSMDTAFVKLAGEDAMDVSIASFKRGYEISDKFDDDIKNKPNVRKALDEFSIFLHRAGARPKEITI